MRTWFIGVPAWLGARSHHRQLLWPTCLPGCKALGNRATYPENNELKVEYLHHASLGIGVLGVLVIVFGVAAGLIRFVRSEFRAARGVNVEEDRKLLRRLLGYYLLLSLEFLIAADIIDTLMKPTVQDLIGLGVIVLIRAVSSYSLNAELKLEKQTAAK